MCAKCIDCAQVFRGNPPNTGTLQSMTVGLPWEKVGVDVNGPHPRSSKGNRFIITAIDHFTKPTFAMPARNHEATTVARFLVDKIFILFGTTRQLLSDRGAEFEGKIIKELCDVMDVA